MAKIGIRVWILIIALLLALLAISPKFEDGVVIKSVELNSSAYDAGLRQGDIIVKIDSTEIKDIQDYSSTIESIFTGGSENKKMEITTKKDSIILFTNKTPEITVANLPRTNIQTGLDLSGGARALLTAENMSLGDAEIVDLISVLSERLNIYGIKDVSIRPVKDLTGNNFVLVEIAGATPADIQSLLASQGKFEAKIANQTVFEGGDRDIRDVCRGDAKCAQITSCQPTNDGGYACQFNFAVYLSAKAAKRHAEITNNISVDETGRYLNEKLYLYIDGKEVDVLSISTDLKGRETTEISIQGSGVGSTQQEAYTAAQKSMQKLQTILITGSIPYKLQIEKLDTISPMLGEEFTKGLIELALVVFAIISLVLFIWYRNIKITFAVILTMFSEAVLTLGVAALIKWNLDAPSIAGIIAGMGTGVNDQIVIISESITNKHLSIKERIKSALFIIIGAFATIIAAMLPLLWAGAGMLKGFALTTIIGVSMGILITRPAFAEIIRRIEG